MQTIETTGEFVNLVAKDWEDSRRVHLDSVPRSATVGEVVGESVRALQLPFSSFFQAVLRGRELNHSDTLDEIGIESDDEIELVPEVSAGKEADEWRPRRSEAQPSEVGTN